MPNWAKLNTAVSLRLDRTWGQRQLLRAQGNRILFLPPYSPDLNPIELTFSKLKTLIPKGAARTYQALWTLVGKVCDLFPPRECRNYFQAIGYETK